MSLEHLAARGIGCPRSISIRGPQAVGEWIEEQYRILEDAGADAPDVVDQEAGLGGDEAARVAQLEEREAADAELRDHPDYVVTLEEIEAHEEETSAIGDRLGSIEKQLSTIAAELAEDARTLLRIRWPRRRRPATRPPPPAPKELPTPEADPNSNGDGDADTTEPEKAKPKVKGRGKS